jgi:very-short-patch-repair endonuclease
MGSKEQCWEKDRLKESLAKSKGFDIFYIWSDSVDNDLQNIVKNILQKISLKV